MPKLVIKAAILRRKARFNIREDVLDTLENISAKTSVQLDDLVEQILAYGLLSLRHD
jgi:hypothetical protein